MAAYEARVRAADRLGAWRLEREARRRGVPESLARELKSIYLREARARSPLSSLRGLAGLASKPARRRWKPPS